MVLWASGPMVLWASSIGPQYLSTTALQYCSTPEGGLSLYQLYHECAIPKIWHTCVQKSPLPLGIVPQSHWAKVPEYHQDHSTLEVIIIASSFAASAVWVSGPMVLQAYMGQHYSSIGPQYQSTTQYCSTTLPQYQNTIVLWEHSTGVPSGPQYPRSINHTILGPDAGAGHTTICRSLGHGQSIPLMAEGLMQ